jgi:hypothetical protein
LALALVVAYAVARLIDPEQRWASLMLGGDRVEHATVAYVITLSSLAAFPRLNLWAPAAALTVFGALVEVVQASPLIVGGAQPGDVAANTAGALAATVPIWLLRGRVHR